MRLENTKVDACGTGETYVVEVSAHDMPTLLVDFLNEVLFMFSSEGLIARGMNDLKIESGPEGYRLKVRMRCERYNPAVHGALKEVKAVTFHRLEVRSDPGNAFARVIFDM